MLTIQKKAPGVILCAILAVPAWFLGQVFPLVGAPDFAILLGMFVGTFYHNRPRHWFYLKIHFTDSCGFIRFWS